MSGHRRTLLGRLATMPKERYIDGYANFGDTITIKINGNVYTTSRNVDNGYFRLDLPKELVITSMEEAFSADTTGYGYGDGVLTYVDIRNIGNLSKCESLYRLCYNQKILSGFSMSKSVMTSLKYAKEMFNECQSLGSLNLTNLDLTNVKYTETDKKDTLNSAFYNCLSLETLKLPVLKAEVYLGTYCFRNCTSLKDLSIAGINTTNELHLQYMPLTDESVEGLLNVIMVGTENGTCYVSQAVHDTMTEKYTSKYNYAIASGWTIEVKNI